MVVIPLSRVVFSCRGSPADRPENLKGRVAATGELVFTDNGAGDDS